MVGKTRESKEWLERDENNTIHMSLRLISQNIAFHTNDLLMLENPLVGWTINTRKSHETRNTSIGAFSYDTMQNLKTS